DTLVFMYEDSLGNKSNAFFFRSSKSSGLIVYPAIFKFSPTVSWVNVLSVWGRYAIPRRAISWDCRFDMIFSLRVTLPRSMVVKPAMVLTSVLFPEPFG